MGQPQSCINEESLNFCSYNFVTGKFIFHIHITYVPVAKSSLISMILALLFLFRQTTQVTCSCVHQLFYCSAYLHPIYLPFHHNIWVLIKSCLTTWIQITYNSQFLFHNCQFLYYYETQYRDFLQLVIIAITPKLNRLLTHYQNNRLV